MSTAAPWRPGDGRSRRSDRVPTDMRVLGRILPASPWRIVDEMPNAMALQQLHSMFQHAGACIGQHIPALEGVLSMSTGHYTETLGVAFGTDLRELLSPGAYIITDSSAAQRVMYVGSSVDGVIRSRLISHLYEGGRVYRSQRAYREAVAKIQAGAFEDEAAAELALRQALFGRHRWRRSARRSSEQRACAAWILGCGAFDVAAVQVPKAFAGVARLLERYLIDAHLSATGALPPLNSGRVDLSKEARLYPRAKGAWYGRLPAPDIALVYANPAQMILLVNGLQWAGYKKLEWGAVGESACADSWGRALATGEPSLALPCFPERRYGGVPDDELLMALKPSQLAQAVEGLKRLSANGLRYPIPPYGVQNDVRAGMAASYGSK